MSQFVLVCDKGSLTAKTGVRSPLGRANNFNYLACNCPARIGTYGKNTVYNFRKPSVAQRSCCAAFERPNHPYQGCLPNCSSGEAPIRGLRVGTSAGEPISGLPLEPIPVLDQISTPVL